MTRPPAHANLPQRAGHTARGWRWGWRQSASIGAFAPSGLNQESQESHEHVHENSDFGCRHRYRAGGDDRLPHPSGHDRKATSHGTRVARRVCPWPAGRRRLAGEHRPVGKCRCPGWHQGLAE
jgi:hypothetical protein